MLHSNSALKELLNERLLQDGLPPDERVGHELGEMIGLVQVGWPAALEGIVAGTIELDQCVDKLRHFSDRTKIETRRTHSDLVFGMNRGPLGDGLIRVRRCHADIHGGNHVTVKLCSHFRRGTSSVDPRACKQRNW